MQVMKMEKLIQSSQLSGILYLQGFVLYQLFTIDLPSSKKSTTTLSNTDNDNKDMKYTLNNALTHYQSRKDMISYKYLVPIACTCMTGGIIGNVILRRGDFTSLTQLCIAFGTAYNNGTNVVDPANSLLVPNTNDIDTKATNNANIKKTQKEQQEEVLTQILKGHIIDVIGFSMLLLGLCL